MQEDFDGAREVMPEGGGGGQGLVRRSIQAACQHLFAMQAQP